MLSIGEFSKICEVTTKTLRYYDEIGLISPSEINPENGYRYYSIKQLESLLFINRLKQYNFSLEDIKLLINTKEDMQDKKLYFELDQKKKEFKKQVQIFKKTISQLDNDMNTLKRGKSIMSYLDNLDTQLVEPSIMYLLYVRKMVHSFDFPEQYKQCFNSLLEKIQHSKLTIVAPPMVLFHSDEFTQYGLDTEFAIPIKEYTTGTRDFNPGLCLKTVLHGSYTALPSVYTKQYKWAEQNGYENNGALYEIYVTDPTQVSSEDELVTEIYYPVKKKLTNVKNKEEKIYE